MALVLVLVLLYFVGWGGAGAAVGEPDGPEPYRPEPFDPMIGAVEGTAADAPDAWSDAILPIARFSPAKSGGSVAPPDRMASSRGAA